MARDKGSEITGVLQLVLIDQTHQEHKPYVCLTNPGCMLQNQNANNLRYHTASEMKQSLNFRC